MDRWNYEVPFDDRGNLIFDGGVLRTTRLSLLGLRWKKAEPFKDRLTYDGYERGRTSIRVRFLRSDGRVVWMFMKDFDRAVQYLGMNGKTLEGEWKYVKKGNHFGIGLVGLD